MRFLSVAESDRDCSPSIQQRVGSRLLQTVILGFADLLFGSLLKSCHKVLSPAEASSVEVVVGKMMAEKLPENPDQSNTKTITTISSRLARAIDFVLNVSLLVVVLIHISYRSGLMFSNPLSERLQGEHTFLWFVGIFILWLAWKGFSGRLHSG